MFFSGDVETAFINNLVPDSVYVSSGDTDKGDVHASQNIAALMGCFFDVLVSR